MDDIKTLKVTGTRGRDVGKTFLLTEIETTQKAAFVLDLVAALKVESWEDMLDRFREHNDAAEDARQAEAQGAGRPEVGAPIDLILSLLQGCNAATVKTLMHEALRSVQIAPDPKHPEAFRALDARDIKELATLGDVLVLFGVLNLGAGA